MFFGDYEDDEQDPSMWFAKFQRMLPLLWNDSQKITHFENHIALSSLAQEWFDDLDPGDKQTLSALRTAFYKQWPRPARPSFSRAEQKERIRELVLKEENVGKWVTPSDKRKADYGQNLWATEVAKMAVNMGDRKGFLIDYVLEGIPNVLKDHLTCRYDTWEEFRSDIRSVPMNKIKRGKETIAKEKARDTEITLLKSQVASTNTLLQAQTVQLARLQLHQPSSTRTSPYTNAPAYTAIPAPSLNATPPAWQPRRPPLTRTALLEKFAATMQRPNTEEGRRQYKVDVDLWHATHGVDGIPTLDKPYPLRPGTATVGMGECFLCGELTDPRHQSGNCDKTEHAPPLEMRWRQTAASLLRRTAQARPPIPHTPVQYVWTGYNQHPQTQPLQLPVYAVNTLEAQATGGNYWDDSNLAEGSWDAENDKGLQTFVDQL